MFSAFVFIPYQYCCLSFHRSYVVCYSVPRMLSMSCFCSEVLRGMLYYHTHFVSVLVTGKFFTLFLTASDNMQVTLFINRSFETAI